MTRQVALSLLSQSAALVSVFALYYASLRFPGGESWDENTEKEKRWRNQRATWAWAIGFPAAVVSIGAQTVLTLWP
jgi:hypothetical protein